MSQVPHTTLLMVVTATIPLVSACTDREDVQIRRSGDGLGVSTDTVHVGDLVLTYTDVGPREGVPLLLIGGTGMQLTDWPPALVDSLVANGYRVVAFDNRDTGLSPMPDTTSDPDPTLIADAMERGEPAPVPYGFDDMATDAVSVLDATGLESAHILGVSMGGAIAQLIAIDHPDRVRSLVLVASDAGDPQLAGLADPELFDELPPAPTNRDEFVEYQMRVERILAGPSYAIDSADLRERIERGVRRSYDPDAKRRQETVSFVAHVETAAHRYQGLRDIEVPTIVLQGTADPLVPVESAQVIAERIPQAELRLVEGLGHTLPPQLVPLLLDAVLEVGDRTR